MIRVNVIYEDAYDDVDIIQIPDSLCEEIENINRGFGGWISPDKNDTDYWLKKPNGVFESILETEGLVKWINQYYVKNGERAVIEKQHVCYNPQYASMEF